MHAFLSPLETAGLILSRKLNFQHILKEFLKCKILLIVLVTDCQTMNYAGPSRTLSLDWGGRLHCVAQAALELTAVPLPQLSEFGDSRHALLCPATVEFEQLYCGKLCWTSFPHAFLGSAKAARI